MHVGQLVAERFTIEGVAGAGAMGTVYQATDATTGSRVAVKVLHTTDARLADRFAREADILQRLDHPRAQIAESALDHEGIASRINWLATCLFGYVWSSCKAADLQTL